MRKKLSLPCGDISDATCGKSFVLRSLQVPLRVDDFTVSRIRVLLHSIYVENSLLLSVTVLEVLNKIRMSMVLLPRLWMEDRGDGWRKTANVVMHLTFCLGKASGSRQQLSVSTIDDKLSELLTFTP